MKKIEMLGVLVGVMLVSGAGQASAVTFTSNGTGLASPGQTITFGTETEAPGTPVVAQYASQGVTFVNAFYNAQDFGFDRNYITNFMEPGSNNYTPLTVNFSSVQMAAALEVIANSGTLTINAFLNGVSVGTGSFSATTSVGTYYNITQGNFDQLVFTAPGNGALEADNLQFTSAAAVPELATWAMMIVGMGAIGFAMRRRNVTTRVQFA